MGTLFSNQIDPSTAEYRPASTLLKKIGIIGAGAVLALTAVGVSAIGGYAVARLADISNEVENSFIRHEQVVKRDAPFVSPVLKDLDDEIKASDIHNVIMEHPNLGTNDAKDFSQMEKNLLARTNLNLRNVVVFIFPKQNEYSTFPTYMLQDDARAFIELVDQDSAHTHDQATDIQLGALPRGNYTYTIKYHYKP